MSNANTDPPPGTAGLNEHGHLVDIGMVALKKKVVRLFEQDPTCRFCKAVIDDAESASIWTPIGGSDMLIHKDCLVPILRESFSRYCGKPRTTQRAS